MRTINEVIVHCTATPEGRHVTVATIRDWHVNQRKWSDIGYHWVVYLDGSIHPGRPEARQGAHVARHNRKTIGIVYVGGVDKNGKPKDTRTPAQKAALVQLLLELKMRYPTITKISGHRDYAAKACPSFDATTEYKDLYTVRPPAAVPKVSKTVEKAAAKGRVSTTDIAAGVGLVTTITAGARQVLDDLGAIQIPSAVMYLIAPIALAALWWIWKERQEYKRMAREELEDV